MPLDSSVLRPGAQKVFELVFKRSFGEARDMIYNLRSRRDFERFGGVAVQYHDALMKWISCSEKEKPFDDDVVWLSRLGECLKEMEKRPRSNDFQAAIDHLRRFIDDKNRALLSGTREN
jgi:hypothetical protein